MKETDAGVLMEFRAAADTLRSQPGWGELNIADRTEQLIILVGPYLKRLGNLGWSQRDRMVTLIRVWNEPGKVLT